MIDVCMYENIYLNFILFDLILIDEICLLFDLKR